VHFIGSIVPVRSRLSAGKKFSLFEQLIKYNKLK